MKAVQSLLLGALILCVQAHAGVSATVSQGTWDLYRGTSIVVPGTASESACIDAAKSLPVAIGKMVAYTCRTRTIVAVFNDPDPVPVPEPVPTPVPVPSPTPVPTPVPVPAPVPTPTPTTGLAAAIGQPSSALINGLTTVIDPSAHFSRHGIPAAPGALPTELAAAALPYIPGVQVLNRRDAVIFYFTNVAGAADYRAYAVNSSVSFVDTANGKQPRGAVIACAGYRQHSYESAVTGGNHTRELLQAVELPGFVVNGNYTIVLEALSSPCPFTGMPAHIDATITGTDFHALDPSTYTYTGIHYAKFVSPATQLKTYGNEIINGQDSLASWANRMNVALGLPAVAADPVVIARNAISVAFPAADEAVNGPVIDGGANGVEDNFANDLVVDPNSYVTNPDYLNTSAAASAPMFSIPGAWQFWGRYIQLGDGQSGIVNGQWNPRGSLGLQVFQRHGRLYTTFGDGGQDVGGSIAFASLKTQPMQLDATKYVHSMFRLNSESTQRRYWTWTMCGGATRDELQDAVTHQYKIRPVFYESSFATAGSAGLYADNPSVPNPPVSVTSVAAAQNAKAKECLSIALDGSPEYPRADGGSRSSVVVRAQIHPAGYSKGIIALGNANSDTGAPYGFRYKTDASGKYVGPMVEPFDQINPLVHFDFFVRRDRLVVFINGRQGFCVDLSARPLTMAYGMVSYGDLLYHSALEWQNIAAPAANGFPSFASQNYQITMNTPIATSRAWDVIGETDMIDIPPQFSTFDPTLCVKPASTTVQ